MSDRDRRHLNARAVSAAYCEVRAANCERLAAEHPDPHAKQELLRIAEQWRLCARDGALKRLLL